MYRRREVRSLKKEFQSSLAACSRAAAEGVEVELWRAMVDWMVIAGGWAREGIVERHAAELCLGNLVVDVLDARVWGCVFEIVG